MYSFFQAHIVCKFAIVDSMILVFYIVFNPQTDTLPLAGAAIGGARSDNDITILVCRRRSSDRPACW